MELTSVCTKVFTLTSIPPYFFYVDVLTFKYDRVTTNLLKVHNLDHTTFCQRTAKPNFRSRTVNGTVLFKERKAVIRDVTDGVLQERYGFTAVTPNAESTRD